MKITNIIRERPDNEVFIVTFEPGFFGRLFGLSKKVKKYMDTGRMFEFGGGTVYCDEDDYKLPNEHRVGEAIDRWRRKIKF